MRCLYAALCAAALALPCEAAAQASLAEVRDLAADERYDEAQTRLDEFLAANPDDVEARLFEGVLYTRQGHNDEAVDVFLALAHEHPELPEPHNNLAVLYASEGRYEEARSALLVAIRLQPRYSTAHENLGDIYAKLANLAYQTAFELDPGNDRAIRKADTIARTFEAGAMPRVASAPEAAAAAATPAPAAPGERACYEVRGIESEKAAGDLSRWLESAGASVTAREEMQDRVVNYKVYIPPLANALVADEQIRRMKQSGVTDIIRISRGDLKNGIALGVYSTEQGARRRMEYLGNLGYETSHEPRRIERIVRTLDVTVAAPARIDRAGFAERFPNRALRDRACG